MGGVYILPVSAEILGIAGRASGGAVNVEVELDTALREVKVPPELISTPDAERKSENFLKGCHTATNTASCW
jgi:DNA-binding protein YbaB